MSSENTNESKKSKETAPRYRNFACIVYPESAPENWQHILAEQLIPSFVSPLHDADVNPTGEPKKAHYHVMLMFEGKKTLVQASSIFEKIGGVGCDIIQSLRGYSRYLCHLDNPEKAQYDTALVKCYCGSDYTSTIGLAIDKYKALSEMQDFCDRYNVLSFYLLMKYARVNRSDWFRILSDCGSVSMREYLKSKQWSKDNNINSIVDPETGEVLL